MRILGIDPGTEIIGFGIIDYDKGNTKIIDFGCIRTHRNIGSAQRLHQIAQDLKTLIQRWNPKILAIEKIFFSKNIKTAMAVSQSRGVILEKAIEYNLKIYEYAPTEIKLSITGEGRADKKQIQKMIKILLSLESEPASDDAADGLAVALCHGLLAQFSSLANEKENQ
ncbi:crossover junction endodeoxyribonuclease RuvC [Candidatus Peregrinibacteria bacterium]|nr:crossover junction endodeoxyribonuclease RuvC [Candidatus Peregrinibacteria bacterium]